MAMYFLLDSCPHKKPALTRSILVDKLNDPLVFGQKSIDSGADPLLGDNRKNALSIYALQIIKKDTKIRLH